MTLLLRLLPILAVAILITPAAAQFSDDFEDGALQFDEAGRDGWFWLTGDGEATIEMTEAGGHASVTVDASDDTRNIWWAFIRHQVSDHIDMEALARADRELRVEARIRSSHAPRRVNLHVNHSRTTDFHSHLKEYDIPDSEGWHVISMTTDGFDARPGDEVFMQMALMDWGTDVYELEVDYITVSVVDPERAGPDEGAPMAYRPVLPALESFDHAVGPAADAVIDLRYPSANLADWHDNTGSGDPLLAVSDTQTTLLRFDMSEWKGAQPDGWGVLALTTDRVFRAETGLEEFGELRVLEILAGAEDWQRESVTAESFFAGQPREAVLNSQMMIDVPAATEAGATTLIGVSPPVLRRLLSGETRGLAIQAQGALFGSFASSLADDPEARPRLYFNTK